MTMTIRRRRLSSAVVTLGLAGAMAAGPVARADEVSITPVYNSLSSGVGRSYIRLFNPSSEADATATLRILSATGAELARLTLPIARLVSKQYEMAELENLATPKIVPTAPAAYIVKVSTTTEIGAYAQHVIYNDRANTFTNASACDTGRTRTRYLINVHTPKTGALGYPSMMVVQNDGVIPAKPYFAISDAEAGRLLTYYTGDELQPQEMRVYNVATLLSAARVTLANQFHVNIALTRFNEYVGFASHVVDNSTSGLFTNMAEMCAVPAETPAAIAAPPASLSASGYYTKYVNADGVAILGTRWTRTSSMNDAARVISHMASKRADIRARLIAISTAVSVAGRDEEMTESPTYTGLRRNIIRQTLSDGSELLRQSEGTRGYGGNPMRYAEEVALGELVNYTTPAVRFFLPVHEYAHTIHAALPSVDAALNTRIKAAYDSAMSKNMWRGAYSSVNELEYFAQGAQVWFQVGTAPSGSTNGNKTLATREELKAYDLELHDILALIFPAEFIPGIPRALSAGETGAAAQERAASVDPLLPPPEIRNQIMVD